MAGAVWPHLPREGAGDQQEWLPLGVTGAIGVRTGQEPAGVFGREDPSGGQRVLVVGTVGSVTRNLGPQQAQPGRGRNWIFWGVGSSVWGRGAQPRSGVWAPLEMRLKWDQDPARVGVSLSIRLT